MAVRLACPACGKAFAPKPADAGRVIPCVRCGSDLQMPAAAPPRVPRPVARPARAEPDEPEAEPAPPRRGRSTPLLYLGVFLASGTVGLLLGAAGFYFALRERPATPGPVAQKPPDTQPATVPPNTEPPKAEPKATPPKGEPKAEAPKVEAKVEPPKVVPPKPKDPVVAPGVAGGLVAADALPGLKFYLSCDTLTDGKMTEAVSGKQLGPGARLALVDGRRGKAVRINHDSRDDNRFALDLSAAREQFTIPAERPFTLAFWARRVRSDAVRGAGAFLLEATTNPDERHVRIMRMQLMPGPAFATVALSDASDRAKRSTLKTAHGSYTVANPVAWNHFALIRGEDGKLRWLVNGADAPDAQLPPFPGELRYDTLRLMRSDNETTIIDLDEFCLFDRALTDNEFGALTGLKVAPRPKEAVAEAKPPAPPAAVPAATDFKGLRFYLPCDAVADGALTEAVSGKNVGKGRKLELIDGPRGKAIRTTASGLGAEREAFVLSEHCDALAVGADKPFTMALWTRTDVWENIGGSFVYANLGGADKFRSLTLYRYTKGVGFLLQQGKPGGGDAPINQLARGTHEMAPTKGWIHLALTRDEKGTVRLVIDGTASVTAGGQFTDEVRFTNFVLVWQQGQPFTADFDEFCLFDRVLTDAELAQLAGRKPKDGPAVAVAPKDPPVVAPKEPPAAPLEVAPPPRIAAVVERPVGVPKDPPAAPPAAVAVSAPAGVDPKGLLLFLPFDEAKGAQLREGTTGRFAGKCEGVELVNGPRGKAARLAGEARLDFSDLAERTNVAEGKPFTLALWFRVEPREPGAKVSGTAVQFGVRPDREYDRVLQIGFGAAGTLHGTARSTPDRLDPKRETAARWAGVANPAKWLHVAVVRDEKSVVKWYVNGKHVPQPGKPDPVWAGPLGFDRVVIGDPEQTKAILEVDELCLFERALTADELKKLSEPGK